MIFDISRIIYIYNIFTVFYSNILTLNLKKIYIYVNVVLPIKKAIIFFSRKKKMAVRI